MALYNILKNFTTTKIGNGTDFSTFFDFFGIINKLSLPLVLKYLYFFTTLTKGKEGFPQETL